MMTPHVNPFVFTALVSSLLAIIGGALRPRLPGKLFWDVHGRDLRALNPEAGLNIILKYIKYFKRTKSIFFSIGRKITKKKITVCID